MNTKFFFAMTVPAILFGCAKTALLEPQNVTVSLPAPEKNPICDNESPKSSAVTPIVAYLIEYAAKYIVGEVTEQVKKDVEDKVKVYKGRTSLACNVKESKEPILVDLKFDAKESKESEFNELTIPIALTTNAFEYNLKVNDKVKMNWSAILKDGKDFNGKVALSVNWVTYTRNGEFIYKNNVVNGDLVVWDIDTQEEKQSVVKKSNGISGLRPPKDSNNQYTQIHEIQFSLTAVDNSLPAKASRELYKFLASKGGSYESQIGDKLKEELGIE